MGGDQVFHVFRLGHLQAIDHRALQSGIVIDEGHRPILVTVIKRGQQLPARLPGAVDQDILRQRAQLGLVIGPHAQAGATNGQHGQGPVDEGHGSGHVRLGEENGRAQHQGGVADTGNDGPDGLVAHEPDDRPVETEAQENNRADENSDHTAGDLQRPQVEI